jgi:short-subunit dehydrogenase
MPEFRGWGGAALVTGGSGGIGLEIARELARRGIDLLLVARSVENLRIHAEKLATAHGIRAEWREADLSTVDGVARLMEELREVDLTFDILVNNAAFGVHGAFANQGPAREAEMVRLNVGAPVQLAAYLLPGMLRRKRGLILNVGSTASFAPVPWIGTYAASKSYLLDWTIALDTELSGTGVRAAVLCPGTTDTKFHQVSGAARGTSRTGVFGQQSPAQVAAECMRGLDRGRRVIVTGWLNRLHGALAAVIPKGIAARIARRALRPSRG